MDQAGGGKNLYQGWVVNPCCANGEGRREKKRLLLAKECLDLLGAIGTRKADLNSLISCRALDRSWEGSRQMFSSKGRKENSRIFCFI